MFRLELDFLNGAQRASSDFLELKSRFAAGVNWEGASFLKIPPEVIDEINIEGAENLVRLKQALSLPAFPAIELLTDWNEILPEEDRLIHEVYGDAVVVKNVFPHGRIRISPLIMKAVVTEKMGIGHKPPVSLAGLLAHEAFHISQFLNDRERVERDLIVRQNKGIEAWFNTQTEWEAIKFERDWVESGKGFVRSLQRLASKIN